VKEYLWDGDALGLDYVGATMTMDPAKSCMRDKAMSKLSPWLAHGCLSPRLLYEEVKRYERERRKTKSTYWITHELLWRDFVRFGSINAGTSIFKIGGIADVHPTWTWSTNQELFSAWKDGLTGFPFIDCFMRELLTTGYCNHMGRETAGWFLIGDLGLDWRMGAEWFESVLIDYEPTANWYNWTYRCLPAASRGGAHGFLIDSPGHRLQGLEILKWGAQHDPDAEYIKRWIPQLASLPATTAREPWRLGLLDNGGRQAGPTDSDRASGNLRPVPSGQFEVSRGVLEQVVAMGFDQKSAAVALYRTREDPDAAVALLADGESEMAEQGSTLEEQEMAKAITLSLGGSTGGGTPTCIDVEDEDEDEDLNLALRMSLKCSEDGPVSSPQPQVPSAAPHGGFRYGIDYPKPVIQPVSIRGIEEKEDEARRMQEQRDRQNATARRRGTAGGAGRQQFDKARWEGSKQQWPAETPTAAVAPGREEKQVEGVAGNGGWRSKGGKGDNAVRSNESGKGGRSRKGSWDGNKDNHERKRRWGAKGNAPEETLRGA
jgi:hypothetical protein